MSAKSCFHREPVRQAHGPEVLEGSETYLPCGYGGTINICATVIPCSPGLHVIWYFCRIGASYLSYIFVSTEAIQALPATAKKGRSVLSLGHPYKSFATGGVIKQVSVGHFGGMISIRTASGSAPNLQGRTTLPSPRETMRREELYA